jgi:hypothetical protein
MTGYGRLCCRRPRGARHFAAIAVIGIDIGKNSFHIIGQNQRGSLVLRLKWSRGQVETRLTEIKTHIATVAVSEHVSATVCAAARL